MASLKARRLILYVLCILGSATSMAQPAPAQGKLDGEWVKINPAGNDDQRSFTKDIIDIIGDTISVTFRPTLRQFSGRGKLIQCGKGSGGADLCFSTGALECNFSVDFSVDAITLVHVGTQASQCGALDGVYKKSATPSR